MKKNLVLIGIILLTIVLAALSVITALKIKQLGTQPVAPSAPQSEPEATYDDTIPEIPPTTDACRKTFLVALAPTATPTPTGTLTPTPTGTLTPTPTSTPKPGVTTAQATPTEVQLPAAGLKLPTLGGILAGFLLISLGIALIF